MYSSSRQRRIRRIRSSLRGTAERPRLTVFRSNQHLYTQIINDQQGKTLLAASNFDLKKNSANNLAQAAQIGELLAERAKKAKIVAIKFDRGPYAYHGRIKALAEAARAGGLKF